jgi:hypothetical protein
MFLRKQFHFFFIPGYDSVEKWIRMVSRNPFLVSKSNLKEFTTKMPSILEVLRLGNLVKDFGNIFPDHCTRQNNIPLNPLK